MIVIKAKLVFRYMLHLTPNIFFCFPFESWHHITHTHTNNNNNSNFLFIFIRFANAFLGFSSGDSLFRFHLPFLDATTQLNRTVEKLSLIESVNECLFRKPLVLLRKLTQKSCLIAIVCCSISKSFKRTA